MDDFFCHSLEIKFSLAMGSPGSPGMVNAKYHPKMQCSITIATLSIFGVKTKTALTGVPSRVRESLASQLIQYF